jgi:hypothetical protein
MAKSGARARVRVSENGGGALMKKERKKLI